jgi:hypothetical protein
MLLFRLWIKTAINSISCDFFQILLNNTPGFSYIVIGYLIFLCQKFHCYLMIVQEVSYDRMLHVLYDQNLIKLNVGFFKFILCMYTSIKSLMGGPETRHTCTHRYVSGVQAPILYRFRKQTIAKKLW